MFPCPLYSSCSSSTIFVNGCLSISSENLLKRYVRVLKRTIWGYFISLSNPSFCYSICRIMQLHRHYRHTDVFNEIYIALVHSSTPQGFSYRPDFHRSEGFSKIDNSHPYAYIDILHLSGLSVLLCEDVLSYFNGFESSLFWLVCKLLLIDINKWIDGFIFYCKLN